MAVVLNPAGPVAPRRRAIASYLYAYTRTLELACAWTMAVRDTAFKVVLGRKIGLDGFAVERLGRRMGQMFMLAPRGAASETFARWLSEHSGETDEGRVAAVLVATIDALERSMRAYCEAASPGDEPTVLMLETLRSELAAGRKGLSSYATTELVAPLPDAAGDVVEYTGTEPLLPVPSFPARPGNAVRDPSAASPPRRTLQESMQPENVAAWFRRAYVEIEISAIEVCARNVVEYRDMSSAFKVDMSQQIWDEARHAELAEAVIKHYGEELGPLHYSGVVWTRHELGVDLAERLAIEQCIQEGNSIDKGLSMVELLRRFGHNEAAAAMEWFVTDETQHAAIGNRWLLRLCEQDRSKYEAVMRTANDKIKFPLFAVNRDIRALGGYPDWYVDQLERELEAKRDATPTS